MLTHPAWFFAAVVVALVLRRRGRAEAGWWVFLLIGVGPIAGGYFFAPLALTAGVGGDPQLYPTDAVAVQTALGALAYLLVAWYAVPRRHGMLLAAAGLTVSFAAALLLPASAVTAVAYVTGTVFATVLLLARRDPRRARRAARTTGTDEPAGDGSGG